VSRALASHVLTSEFCEADREWVSSCISLTHTTYNYSQFFHSSEGIEFSSWDLRNKRCIPYNPLIKTDILDTTWQI
jgi:hypothetical protein